jgi:restriction system protein
MAKALKHRFLNYMPATVEALRALGNSARPKEVVAAVERLVTVPPEDLVNRTKSGQTLFENDVHWCRAYLARAGYIDSTQRGVWRLTESGKKEVFDKAKVDDLVRRVQGRRSTSDSATGDLSSTARIDIASIEVDVDEGPHDENDYSHRTDVLTLLKSLSPSGFEQFCHDLLLESGFESVEVKGRTGDKGIDGVGVLKVNHLYSLKVVFQAKKYEDSVGAPAIRDFRGASLGRADRALLITTGVFTRDAVAEASRDGVAHIELIDGQDIVELMEKLEFGLVPRKAFTIDSAFFGRFSQ